MINTRPIEHGILFTVNKYGIYYNDMSNTKGVSMLINVEENQKKYTQWKYDHAKIVIELYQTVVHT